MNSQSNPNLSDKKDWLLGIY